MSKLILICSMSLALCVSASATVSHCRGATEKIEVSNAASAQLSEISVPLHTYELAIPTSQVLYEFTYRLEQADTKSFSIMPALAGTVVSINRLNRTRWAIPWQIGKPDTKRHIAWRCPVLKLC